MDRLIVQERLESLRRCIARVEAKRSPTVDALAGDPDAQDILSLNLTRAVQLCVDIGAHLIADTNAPSPQNMGETFDRLAAMSYISSSLAARMKAAVGFRNVVIHHYQTVDWEIVHRITHERLDDFREFARAMASRAGC